MPLFVVWGRLDFVILVVLAIHEEVPKGREIHYEMLFVIKEHTADLHRQERLS